MLRDIYIDIYIKPIHVFDYYWKRLRRTRFDAQGKIINLFQVDYIIRQEYQIYVTRMPFKR